MKNREFIQKISVSFTGTEDDETRIWNQEDFVNASTAFAK